MKYDVDSETREFLESVLNIVVGVAELQYDDSAKAGLQSLVTVLADRFSIEIAWVDVDEHGNMVVVTPEDEDLPEPTIDDPDSTVH